LSPRLLSIFTYPCRTFCLATIFPNDEFPLFVDYVIAAAKNAPECCDLKSDPGREPYFELGAAGRGLGGSEAISFKIL